MYSHIQHNSSGLCKKYGWYKIGGLPSDRSRIATQIWEWCQLHKNWISVSHIPGIENSLADLRSHTFKDQVEWELNPVIFEDICNTFGG